MSLAATYEEFWELDRIRAWRAEMLMALGVPREDAFTLSVCRDLDWHQAEELVEKGCPPELVLELLT